MNLFGLTCCQKKLFQKIYTFPYCRLGHFPKCGARPPNSSFKFLLLGSGPYDSHTTLCQRAVCMVEWCSNVGTLVLLLLLLLLCMSRSGDPPWILKWAGLESSGQRLISSTGKIKKIAFFFWQKKKYF